MLRKILITLLVLILGFFGYLGYVKTRVPDIETKYPLKIKWEGLYLDKNFRDIGQSINQCLGEQVMTEKKVFRSNGWFSGWECDEVGNPDSIITLNFDPTKKEMYFCVNDQPSKVLVGQVPDDSIKMDDLEFIDNWKDDQLRGAACKSIEQTFQSILQYRSTLIHCSAGRDRTGVLSALLSAMVLERKAALDESGFEAIECDYRKTDSLVPEKFGRMERFIQQITRQKTIGEFLENQCGISEQLTLRVTDSLSYQVEH